MKKDRLFDKWPDRYDRWFQSPIGKLIKEYETNIVLELLNPRRGEMILDAGCGTGIFTVDFLAAGAHIIGLEISLPMLIGAVQKTGGHPFDAIQGDLMCLPFKDNSFDKVVSITTLEFIENAKGAVNELFRVTRQGGRVVVATLNSLSPWAVRRKAKTSKGQKHILEHAFFRSPQEIKAIMPYPCVIKTAIHFNKEEEPFRARKIEQQGQVKELNTGAFVAALCQKSERGFIERYS